MFNYVPAPHERAYYGALFQTADVDRSGTISSTQAVTFLTRSKLPIPILKEIWTASDQPLGHSLDARKFAVAVRLVQLAQNNLPLPTQPGTDLTSGFAPDLRPAYFEGIPQPPMLPKGPPSQQPQQPMAAPSGGGSVAPSVTGGQSVGSNVAGPPPPTIVTQQQQPQQQPPPPSPHTQQLAMQDPYSMTPTDHHRYDQMFPEYASPNDPNYLYGPEAVALFAKSGLQREALAQIWSMVDSEPVDNRLDKVEFALAMHLVICVSIKRLPLPTTLPPSLVHFKRAQRQVQSQQQQQSQQPMQNGNRAVVAPEQQQPPAMAQQQQPPLQMSMPSPQPQMSIQPPTPTPSQPSMMGGGGGGSSVGQAGFGVMPPQATSRGSMPSPMQPPMPTTAMPDGVAGLPQAPPLSGLAGPPPLTQTGGLSISDAFEGLGGAGDTGSISSYGASTPIMAPHSNGFAMPSSSSAAGMGTGGGSASYDMPPSLHLGDVKVEDHDDDDDDDHGQQPGRTVPTHAPPATTKQLASAYDMGESNEELVKLRNALQKLQAENISLKAKMGTMTDEERDLQKELNATIAEVSTLSNELTKTRAQVLASKSRLLESTAELRAAQEKKGVLKDLIADATATKQAIDEAYESIENANEEARHAASVQQQQPAPVVEETDLFGGWGDDNAAQPPLPASDTYDSYDSADTPAPLASSAPSTLNNYSQEPPSYSFIAGQTPAAAMTTSAATIPPPSTDMYSGGGYTLDRGVLNREASEGFGEVMGGGPTPLLQQPSGYTSGGTSMSPTATFDSIPVAVSMKEVEDLQSRSKEADDVAKEAEASRRQLVAQLEELRKVADEAESKARAAADKPTKKKGLLGRGGAQKKDAKEVEKLNMDARDKKDAMLLVQSQVKDAESVAKATKQEAEKLNKAAEEAQMAAAAAASMQDQSRAAAPATDNGYAPKVAPIPPSYGMAPVPPTSSQPMYGMSNAGGQPPLQDGGFGGPPLGYDSHVMGNVGGMSIPTPSAMDDPYSNPFE